MTGPRGSTKVAAAWSIDWVKGFSSFQGSGSAELKPAEHIKSRYTGNRGHAFQSSGTSMAV